MAGGRPTKYRKEYCETIIPLMAEGMAKVEVCAKLGIDYNTFMSWQDKHPKFFLSVKKGDKLSKAWWMKQGRIALRDGTFNSTLWYMNMKNRHGWADKKEVKVAGALDLNVNEMSEERKAELKEIAKIRSEMAIKALREKDGEADAK